MKWKHLNKWKHLQLSARFYVGVIFIILSLIIGKITQVTFWYYYDNKVIRWTSAIVYILSWIPFIIGILWVGREYAQAIHRYFSYKFYHESLKRGLLKTTQVGKKVVGKALHPKRKAVTPEGREDESQQKVE